MSVVVTIGQIALGLFIIWLLLFIGGALLQRRQVDRTVHAVTGVHHRDLTRQARTIVDDAAADLADATGLDYHDVRREIIRRKITPGEWALEHGLHPTTFRPLD